MLGSFSSAVFLYGMALVYGAIGSTNLAQIADYLGRNILLHNGLLLAGIALLLVGFGFKIATVPFHLWTPDVYQGSPSPVTGFMAAVAKTGGFAALLRVFVSSFPTVRADWQPIIWVLAVITLLLGAAVGVVQRDVKRMLAYSSINHAGFILLGLYLVTVRGVSSSLYYLFTYTFMVMGSFAVITVVAGLGDTDHDLDTYRGLARRQPWLAVPMIIFLLAQAGMPATTGLWAKVYVIEGVVGTPGGDALAVIAMVSAVDGGILLPASRSLHGGGSCSSTRIRERWGPDARPGARDPVVRPRFRQGRTKRRPGRLSPCSREIPEPSPPESPMRISARRTWRVSPWCRCR